MNVVVTSGLAGIGHNSPPKTPFEESRDEIELLWMEAANWADGVPITTALQEAEVDRLMGMIRDAEKLADARRVAENEPFDTGKAEVQARYNPLIQPKKGKTQLALDALKKVVGPWRQKVADEKAKVAEAARLEAERLRKAAQEAMRGSSFDQLAERAAAETLLEEAEKAERVSAKANKTATTGLGLRTVHRAEIVNRTEFARYVWNQHPDDIAEFLTALAPRLVSRGLRNMPGVVVHEEKVAV